MKGEVKGENEDREEIRIEEGEEHTLQQSQPPHPQQEQPVVKRRRGRPRKVTVAAEVPTTERVAVVTEGAGAEPTVATAAVVTTAKPVQLPKRVIRRLTKLGDRLEIIEGMLRPLKSVEKDRSSIKDMQKQLKVIARQVTRLKRVLTN